MERFGALPDDSWLETAPRPPTNGPPAPEARRRPRLRRLTPPKRTFYARRTYVALSTLAFSNPSPGGKGWTCFSLCLARVASSCSCCFADRVLRRDDVRDRLQGLPARAGQPRNRPVLDTFGRSNGWKKSDRAKELRRSPVAAQFRAGYLELVRLTKKRGKGPAAKTAVTPKRPGKHRTRAPPGRHRRDHIDGSADTTALPPSVHRRHSSVCLAAVWGIMDAFRNIGSKGTANLATVAPGIAEALITTAIGLVAAIPAVMAFNYFARRIKVLAGEMDTFHNDLLNIIKRNYLN